MCIRDRFYYDIEGKSLATPGVEECESNGHKKPCVSSRKSYDKNQWSHFRAFDGKDVNNAGFCTSKDNKGAGWLRCGGMFYGHTTFTSLPPPQRKLHHRLCCAFLCFQI